MIHNKSKCIKLDPGDGSPLSEVLRCDGLRSLIGGLYPAVTKEPLEPNPDGSLSIGPSIDRSLSQSDG